MNDQRPSTNDSALTAGDVSPQEMTACVYEFNLLAVLTQLAYRKRLIAKVTGVSIVAGLILCFALPVHYTATAKIMPPQQTQSTAMMLMSQLTGATGNPLAALAGGGLGLKNPNDIYVGLLTSRTVADAIIGKFDLKNVYRVDDLTHARKRLGKYTDVVSEKNGFISISVTDKDKARAAGMANAYTEELRALTNRLAVTEASRRRLFYEGQLKQSREDLVTAALAFEQVQQKKGLVQLDAQAKAMIEGFADLRAQIAAKEVEIQGLRSYSTEKNPELQLAEKELDSLRGQADKMERNSHTPGITGLGLEGVPSAGLEYLRAEHELRYQQALYDTLMKQYDAAKLDESQDAAIIQVVEPAIDPEQKSSPERAQILVQCMIAGFLIGCVMALFPWWKALLRSDPQRKKSLEDLKNALAGRRAAAITERIAATPGNCP